MPLELDWRGWFEWVERGRPSPVVVNPKDGSILLYVPAGEFEMGEGSGRHRVYLDAYYVGAYCVTNAQYARFLTAVKPSGSDVGEWILLDSDCFVRRVEGGYEAYGGKENHPVVQVSWHGARAYAQRGGLSLPTEAQWERAARGPKGLEYPWGKECAPRCRHDRNRGSEKTAAVSAYPAGVSGEGAYNLSGNVWEWCADWYDSEYYARSPRENPRGPEAGSGRVCRGGGWYNSGSAYFQAANRYWYAPGYRWNARGFRLVRQLASLPSETGPSRGVGVGGRGSAAR